MDKYIAIILGVCAVTVTAGVGLSFGHSQLKSDVLYPTAATSALYGASMASYAQPTETQILRRTTAGVTPPVTLASVKHDAAPSLDTPTSPQLARVETEEVIPAQTVQTAQAAKIRVLRPKSRPTHATARIDTLTASIEETLENAPIAVVTTVPRAKIQRVARSEGGAKASTKANTERKLRTRNLIGVYR